MSRSRTVRCEKFVRKERWTSTQCSRRAREGSRFCKQHDPTVEDPTVKLWAIVGPSGGAGPKLVSVDASETSRQYTLAESLGAFGYRTKINKEELVRLGIGTSARAALDLARARAERELTEAHKRVLNAEAMHEGLKGLYDLLPLEAEGEASGG